MNKDIKRYFKECQYLFAYCGKKERKYLDKLRDNIDDGSHELNYDEIVERLGSPQEIIMDYYNQEDVYELKDLTKKEYDSLEVLINKPMMMLSMLSDEEVANKMVDEMMYHCKEKGMPLIHLTIDEHTGEAGFVTRLEAFVDMLMRKKRSILNKQSAKTQKQTAEIVKIRDNKILTGSAK